MHIPSLVDLLTILNIILAVVKLIESIATSIQKRSRKHK
jgi:hypothetical protein